jgi:hypothetical protein
MQGQDAFGNNVQTVTTYSFLSSKRFEIGTDAPAAFQLASNEPIFGLKHPQTELLMLFMMFSGM